MAAINPEDFDDFFDIDEKEQEEVSKAIQFFNEASPEEVQSMIEKGLSGDTDALLMCARFIFASDTTEEDVVAHFG